VDRDEFSGNLQRPGVDKIIGLIKKRAIDAVIVAKLDRLTRSTRDAITLMELCSENKVALVSLQESLDTSSPMGRFVVRLFASLAELERETICERITVGMQNLKRHGMPAGTAPYGWRNVGKKKPLEPNDVEQGIIAHIRRMRAEGKSLREIAEDLNILGSRTRKGTTWKAQYVFSILKSEISSMEEQNDGQPLPGITA
jgi:DNA invertase Pin-like site-specific DNA recombinase